MDTQFSIEEWLPDHPHYAQLTALIAQLEQTSWMEFNAEWHLSSHMLAASQSGRVVGFLRYVIQEIGVEEDLPPFTFQGEALREAKVIAFGVEPAHRRQGIGRALQDRLIADAREAGLYQVRSHSSLKNQENHRLKIALGFAIHPLPAGKEKDGAYFILPL